MKRSIFYTYLIALGFIWMLGIMTVGAGGYRLCFFAFFLLYFGKLVTCIPLYLILLFLLYTCVRISGFIVKSRAIVKK